MDTVHTPILQFGTSRFLQAHVDLFVDEALEQGKALGRIAVVQTTDNPQSAARIAAFRDAGGYPVRIRGLESGSVIDRERRVTAIGSAYHAMRDWPALRRLMAEQVQVVVSNTGDCGYEIFAADRHYDLEADTPPAGFPAKLLALLHVRYQGGGAPLTICPCELLPNNGAVLRNVVLDLARSWKLGADFLAWIRNRCTWVNSLVDRIVSETIEPAGTVAEPYAIWVPRRTLAE